MHVMSLLAKEEVNNVAFVTSLNAQAVLPPTPTAVLTTAPIAATPAIGALIVKFPG